MKYTILLFCLLASFTSSIAKTPFSGVYSLDLNEDNTCYIDFYNNNRYTVEFIVSLSDDISEATTLSYGRFTKKENIIILHDTLQGFKMKLNLQTNNTIKIEKGFAFSKNKEFRYYGENYDKEEWTKWENYKYPITSYSQSNERSGYKRHNTYPYLFHVGQYESENNTFIYENEGFYETGLGYELNIEENNNYQLYYAKILISEGKWKRDGNELSLFDVGLKHPFYVLINEKKLISTYLPGDFKGISLFPKKNIDLPVRTKSKIEPFADYFSSSLKVEPAIEPYRYLEEKPRSSLGDEKEILRFIEKNTRYPGKAWEAGLNGRVFVSFVVEKDGSIGSIEIKKSLSKECDEEAIRIVKSMPRWIPGKHQGKIVSAWYSIPVEFRQEK
jgi:TonB family protein